MKEWKSLVKKEKTKNKQGFTNDELEDFIKKQNLDKKKFNEVLGVNTCLIVNGEVIIYKQDVLNALNKYYGLGGFLD